MAVLFEAPSGGFGAQLLKSIGISGVLTIVGILIVGQLFFRSVYRVYFHPLSSFPGPRIAALTRLWFIYHLISGDLVEEVHKLHEQYGSTVRIAPDELSFTSGQGWKDIYGFRRGKPEMTKDTPFYKSGAHVETIIIANQEHHAYLRRLMSRGFSEGALQQQEPTVQSYVDLLMDRLRQKAIQNRPANMVSWYNFLTFDVVGDLAFGEPFGCLETSSYHPWVKIIFDSIHFVTVSQAIAYYPKIQKLVPISFFKSLSSKYKSHLKMTREKAMRRKESKVDRADFMSNLCKPENNISDTELCGNSSTLIIAGSETTATVLSAATWFLLQNPKILEKLTAEIRSSFKSKSEITFENVSKMQYLLACLNETMRVFPAAPTGLARRVPAGGDDIDGRFVPGGTQVSVFQYASNMNSKNWNHPMEFIPERWMDDPRFVKDDRASFQPFSYGPRDCIGRNLAYVEMRLVLARILFEFDLELTEDTKDWTQAKIWTVWRKHPLWIKLKLAV